MKTIKIFKNRYVTGTLLLLGGLFLGWLIFYHPDSKRSDELALHETHDEAVHEIWTCAMHPQIRMDEPGACPICGMDLIPLTNSSASIDDRAIELSESAIKLADIQTSTVVTGTVSKMVRLYGTIQPDERRLQSQTGHIPGRIEELTVNSTGEKVRKGQLLARIYSPELVAIQKEVLEAVTLADKYPEVVEAAREKLRNLKLSDDQIAGIEKSGKVTTVFNMYANTSGTIMSRRVNEGDYIMQGDVLYEVADLSKVWGLFDAYESDLPWIRIGLKVEFTAQALPGKKFEGKITFIDPFINPMTRVAKVRIELSNPAAELKPEMFINGIVQSSLKGDASKMTIPQTAVLWTGTRSVVYVKLPDTEIPTFRLREVTLGAAMKDTYVIEEGLAEGEEIVTHGTFSVDAAAQLAGKPSMMSLVQLSDGVAALLKESLTGYLALKDALVASDPVKAGSLAQELMALTQTGNRLDRAQNDDASMRIFSDIHKHISEIAGAKELEPQRAAFAKLSLSYHPVISLIQPDTGNLYYQFCPMAFDNKGAFWISADEEISNPFFGDEMLRCGEIKETYTRQNEE